MLPRGRSQAYAVHVQRTAQADVSGRGTHQNLIAARWNLPAAVMPDGKAAVIKGKGQRLALAGLQRGFDKRLQLLGGAVDSILRRGYIQLHDLGPGSVAGVRHGHGDGAVCNLQIGIGKLRVAQPISKGEAHGLARLVIIAVADIQPLFVVDDLFAEGVAAGYIRIAQRPCFGQLAAGIGLAGQQVGRRRAARLTGQPHIQHGLDLIQPRRFHRTAAEQHDNRVGVGGGHGFNQAVVALRHGHRFAVKAFGFVNIGQPCADHGDVCLFGGGCCSGEGFLRHVALFITAGVERHGGQSIAEGGQHGGVDVAGARALIPHGARHLANQHNVRFRQRQNAALVFQQHRAVFGNFLRQSVVGVLVKWFTFGAGLAFECQRNHARRTGVHITFGQGAVPHGRGHTVLHVIAAARHTQITSGVHGLDAVAERTPVGDNKAVKAPVAAQYLGQQPSIVAGVDIVDARIAAHNGLGLCVFDNGLKRGQIQLPQGALVDLTVAVEPLVLLIVGGKMLQARARTTALRTLHPCCAHGTGCTGVLGEIFKIAATEGVALDVDAGAKDNVHAVGKPFFADGFALGLQQRCIPRCSAGNGSGKAGRWFRAVDAEHIACVFLAAHAVGAVAHPDGRDAVLLHCLAVPEISAVAKADFLLQRHF